MTQVWNGSSYEAPAAAGSQSSSSGRVTSGEFESLKTRVTTLEGSTPIQRHRRVTTGAIAGGASAEVTVTWATAFADANYTVVTSMLEATTGTNSLRIRHIVSKTAAAIVVRVTNDDAINAKTGEIQASAFHD